MQAQPFKTVIFLVIFILIDANDYYELLGVSKDADNREIRRAFKKLALTLHPDKNTDDPNAHDNFIKINKAYEVLKDEETRKKYDLYGEEGLKDNFGKSWRGNYQSWNYYYESFGIYDDDPEIITLSKTDFEQSVLDSPDVWFINYYSPQCSHCHHLAPAWRSLARELEGVIRIGAVNCEEDWILCRQQNIHSYPSLIMYPQKTKYQGSRDTEAMADYVLQYLPDNVIDLTIGNLDDMISRDEYKAQPWLISVCEGRKECLFKDVLKKLGVVLEGLVNVAEVNIQDDDEKICKKLNCSSPVTFYQDLSQPKNKGIAYPLSEMEMKGILNEVLQLLPGAEQLNDDAFRKLRESSNTLSSKPWLIHFTKRNIDEPQSSMDTELKKIRALLPNVQIGQINCVAFHSVCSSLYLHKFPVFIVFKPDGKYELYHGRMTAHDIASFVRESLSSRVETLGPQDFPDRILNSEQLWFVDFFAPWCPPCMQLLPEWRKASRAVGHLVSFGTVDCTMHASLCSKYNIRSYPTTILYNQTVPHQFHGSHTSQQLEEFVKDTLNPPVITLSPTTFSKLVEKKGKDEIWVIDFFAPWCGPCQQLAPQWRKLAKMLVEEPDINVGQVDCQMHRELCSSLGVQSYPTIRLYPKGSTGTTKFSFYNGWNRDANSLRVWIFNFLPSIVTSLSSSDFFNTVLFDPEPWIIDFYAPWCGHCQVFAPEFEKVAKRLQGKVKAGKLNCDEMRQVCHSADINAYPTVVYYAGSQVHQSQSPVGEEIHSVKVDTIVSYVEKQLKIQKKTVHRDEL